ncbi:MAG TPA: hypothetical protein VK152_06945 [Paludibacter sp.]|nr:hypothetical protein [Paludibacter sp.]
MFKLLLKMVNVLKSGFKTLSEASRGAYNQRTNEVNDLREEMPGTNASVQNDKKNLKSDPKKIGNDMRRSANKMVLNNG